MTANHHSALYHAPWTAEEDERLARLWPDPAVSKDDLLLLMGRTMRAMSGRARTNNLGRRGSVPNGQGFWTDERLAHLRKMFDEGLSFSQMAEQIGHGCTRAGCIGKANRLGWERPDETWRLNLKRATAKATAASREAFRKRREEKAWKVESPKAPPPPKPVSEPQPPKAYPKRKAFRPLPGFEPVSLLQVKDHHCRWPIDCEDGETRFCGRRMVDHRYCRTHRGLARGEGTKSERNAVKIAMRVAA